MQLDTPKKILIIRIDRVGDMLSATPAIRALRQAYPDARIDLMASTGNARVVCNNPHIDNLIVFPLKKFWLWPLYFMKLRFSGYDWVVELNGISGTATRLAKATGARIKAAPANDRRKGNYNVTVTPSNTEHMIRQQLRLVAKLGAQSNDTAMVFPVKDEWVDNALARLPRRKGIRRVGMFIGNAKKTETRWPEGKFVALANELSKDKTLEVCVLAGPGDLHLLEGFTWSDNCLLYRDKGLEDLAGFLKTCDLLVTSSTGPKHLAAACGVPIVAILAQFTFDCWRPLGDIHHNINSGHPGQDVRGIEVAEVLDAVQKTLMRNREMLT